MKLILAIVHDIDGNNLMSALNKEGYSVTKLATTGGFLKAGNTTLMVGVSDENVEAVVDVIRAKCDRRKRMVVNPNVMGNIESSLDSFPVEIDVGGATIFVLDVDRFEKI